MKLLVDILAVLCSSEWCSQVHYRYLSVIFTFTIQETESIQVHVVALMLVQQVHLSNGCQEDALLEVSN